MITYNIHHVDGLYFELTGDEGKNREYDVTFIDNNVTKPIYETKLKPGGWSRLDRKYLSNISIFVKYQGRIVKQINLLDELAGKRIFVVFESKSLGDSIAWMPYCLEMQEVYKCKVIVSTFKNELFESVYPELEFAGRGVVLHNIIARVELGWFWDEEKEPIHPVTIPLQQTASNILALPFKEIHPRIAFTPGERPVTNPYIYLQNLQHNVNIGIIGQS